MKVVKDEEPQAKEATKKVVKPQFDPNKGYKWEADDRFNITGQEFAILVQAIGNTVKSDVSMPIQAAILLDRSNQVLNSVLARYVELGVAREYSPPQPEKLN